MRLFGLNYCVAWQVDLRATKFTDESVCWIVGGVLSVRYES